MGAERRNSVKQPDLMAQPGEAREEVMITAKPFVISKHRVYEAYRLVKANAGSAGVDKQSIAAFEEDLKDNLYKLGLRVKLCKLMLRLIRKKSKLKQIWESNIRKQRVNKNYCVM